MRMTSASQQKYWCIILWSSQSSCTTLRRGLKRRNISQSWKFWNVIFEENLWYNQERSQTECGHTERTFYKAGYHQLTTDAQTVILWSYFTYEHKSSSLHTASWPSTRNTTKRETPKKMARQHSGRLCGSRLISSWGISARFRQTSLDERYSQYGLPEREDLVIVARALSQTIFNPVVLSVVLSVFL